MIAAMKQYGVNVARREIRRYVISAAVFVVAVVFNFGYHVVTGHWLGGDSESQPARVRHAAATTQPAAAAPAPAAAPEGQVFTPQGIDINAPKRAAQKAVDAENAQLSAQTGQAIPVRGQSAPASGPGSNGVATSAAIPTAGALNAADVATPSKLGAPVTREAFTYAGEGRRDPFFSLILTDDLRPLLADLRLVGILYEASGRRTVAIMRDLQTNAQYRVTNGATIGRMRVAQIRPRAVIFSIDEFGLSRQDSLVWSDTTKVRN
jgi:hypothetical protein